MTIERSNHTTGFIAKEMPPRVVLTSMDWEAEGKQHGYLSVPYSSDESAWGAVRVPITLIRNGTGPSVLFTGGNHGDEYEGPIALKKIANQLDAENFRGSAVIIPALNPPAVHAGTRVSPIDGVNMNRSFPGKRTGSVTKMICHYVSTRLLPEVDAVVDIHSGGKTLRFVPFSAMHYLEDAEQFERTRAMMKAFGAPISLVIEELDTEGMLDGVVEDTGKPFIFTELGGGGTATPETVGIAERGIINVLRHFDIYHGEPLLVEKEPVAETRMMATPDGKSYTISDETGLFEMLVNLGDSVEEGQLLARIHSIEKTEVPPSLYYAHRSGTVVGRHYPGLARPGDCLAVIAIDDA